MDYDILNKLPVWCKSQGVEFAILCGGSRSAPLTLSFGGYNEIRCIAANDERSAGFIALGLAKASKKPVVIVTTSGTAVANLYPAAAEAFYQNIPLLIFTADREPNAALHFDGQAINQENIFGKQVKGFFQMPVNITDSNLFNTNMLAAFELLYDGKPGPVHINFPFIEPFYPADYPFVYDNFIVPKLYKITEPPYSTTNSVIDELQPIWDYTQKKLLVCGFGSDNNYDKKQIYDFAKHHKIPVIADVTSNIVTDLYHTDLLIRNIQDIDLFAPDLVITIGGNHTSKVLKNYIQTTNYFHHWHISPFATEYDFFEKPIENTICTNFLVKEAFEINVSQQDYYNVWQEHSNKGKEAFNTFIKNISWHELVVVKNIMENIPVGAVVHLANSMAVRWANIIGNPQKFEIYCNRGTSGIDGCNSTALGMAMAQPHKQHFLITGDMAFQYDSNAFFNNDIPPNLAILILNNNGGNIFKLIDGPTAIMPLEKYFANKHGLTFEYLAKHFGLDYVQLNNHTELETHLYRKFKKTSIAEIIFSAENYKAVFDQYKNLKF